MEKREGGDREEERGGRLRGGVGETNWQREGERVGAWEKWGRQERVGKGCMCVLMRLGSSHVYYNMFTGTL